MVSSNFPAIRHTGLPTAIDAVRTFCYALPAAPGATREPAISAMRRVENGCKLGHIPGRCNAPFSPY